MEWLIYIGIFCVEKARKNVFFGAKRIFLFEACLKSFNENESSSFFFFFYGSPTGEACGQRLGLSEWAPENESCNKVHLDKKK
jgi:hypothetical protein